MQHPIRSLLAACAALGALAAALPASAGVAEPAGETQVVVLLERPASAAEAAGLAAEVGGTVEDRLGALEAVVLTVPAEPGALAAAGAELLDEPLVEAVVPAARVPLLVEVDDPRAPEQWGLAAIRAPAAWDVTMGAPDVLVAVVDTGVDASHPDLAGKVVPGRDTAAEDDDPTDTHGHGTHVAGIAAARADDGLGIAGVAPDVGVLAVKVFPDGVGYAWDYDIAEGIAWAADHGADVINLSLGSAWPSTIMGDAVAYATGKGVLVVAAAGNTGTAQDFYPAAFPGAVAVAATASDDQRAGFSTMGAFVDLAAPGVGILSTVPGGGYASWSGTSMAAPHVAGAAALLLSFPGATAAGARQALEETAVDLGAPGVDESYGHGRLDLAAAVSFTPAPPPPAIDTAALPDAVVGTPYAVTLAASSGTPPYAWSLDQGALPAGLALTPGGLVAGTPASAGTFPVVARVTDANGRTGTRSLTLVSRLTDLTGAVRGFASRGSRLARTVSGTVEVTRSLGTPQLAVAVDLVLLDRTGRTLARKTVVLTIRAAATKASATFSLSGANVAGGRFEARVDAPNGVAESSETNNVVTVPLPR